jgi:hypothetical protein
VPDALSIARDRIVAAVSPGALWLLLVAVLFVASALPIDAYRSDLSQVAVGRHPLRSMRDCIHRFGATDVISDRRPPVYVEGGNVSHPVAFYFRTLGRWSPQDPSDSDVYVSLLETPRPVLLPPARFRTLEVAWKKSGRLADVLAVPLID